MRVLGERSCTSFVTCLMTVLTSVPFGVRAGRRMMANRSAAPYVIDVHVREPALVLVRVPEGKLLPAMRRNEGIVDVKHLNFARRYRRAELIDHSHSGSRRIRFARRILHSRDGWLRREWIPS